jgi:high-affinity nickel permease
MKAAAKKTMKRKTAATVASYLLIKSENMNQLPLFLLLTYALYEGLTHAFEADHVLAVSNIVSQRSKVWPAIKDGIFWGLGHTSTILLIGVAMILFKVNIPDSSFRYFEAAVGLMLIIVALYRLALFIRKEHYTIHRHSHEHAGTNKGLHIHVGMSDKGLHKTAYGIGIVHGLAGSGALVVLVMAQIDSVSGSLLYLLLFGAGSIAGMMLVSGIFSLPFSKKLVQSNLLKAILVWFSSQLCFAYGCYSIYQNLFA